MSQPKNLFPSSRTQATISIIIILESFSIYFYFTTHLIVRSFLIIIDSYSLSIPHSNPSSWDLSIDMFISIILCTFSLCCLKVRPAQDLAYLTPAHFIICWMNIHNLAKLIITTLSWNWMSMEFLYLTTTSISILLSRIIFCVFIYNSFICFKLKSMQLQTNFQLYIIDLIFLLVNTNSIIFNSHCLYHFLIIYSYYIIS